jgi:hypothetical protein
MKTMIAVKMGKPKKGIHEMVDDADTSILDELIGNCESKMGSKFKKQEPEIEVDGEKDSSEEDAMEGLDENKMEMLMEMYKKLKGA